MGFHSIDDPTFWTDVTPEALHWTQEIPRKANMEMATIPIDQSGDCAMSILRLEPGGAIPRHAHGCKRVEVVLRGSLDTGGRTATPGTVMVSEPGEFYGPHVAGPEGAVLLEAFGSLTAPTTFDDQGDPAMKAIIDMASDELARLLPEQADRSSS